MMNSSTTAAAVGGDDTTVSSASASTVRITNVSTKRGAPARASIAASNPKGRTLLEEIEEALAQSLLIFLVADLRLMSATGRIETKYETIAIASDPPTRSTAAELAGLETDFHGEHESTVKNQQEGLSPAQIMAILMLELNKTVKNRRKRERELELLDAAGLSQTTRSEEDEFAGRTWVPDKKSGNWKLRAEDDDMYTLLRCYAEMVGHDLKSGVQHIEKRYSMLNLNPPKMDSIGEEEELDVVEEEDLDVDEVVQKQPIGQAAGDAVAKVTEETKQKVTETKQTVEKNVRRANKRRQSMMKSRIAKTDEKFGELADALFQQGEGNKNLRASLAQSLGRQNRTFTSDELTAFVEKAVESRVYGQLDFLADVFKDGSVSKLMAESKARVVWMNDWYPLKVWRYTCFCMHHSFLAPVSNGTILPGPYVCYCS